MLFMARSLPNSPEPVKDRANPRREPRSSAAAETAFETALPYVVGGKGAVEPRGGFGQFGRGQLEQPSRGPDEFGRDVTAAASAAHVIEGLGDGVHVEFPDGDGGDFHFLSVGLCDGRFSHPGFR